MTIALQMLTLNTSGKDLPCTEQPDLFFGHEGEGSNQRVQREAQAKLVCSRCAVREGCLQEALQDPRAAGIMGGLTTKERDRMRGTRKIAPL